MAAIGGLKSIRDRIKRDFGLTPVIATEIEFYLPGVTGAMRTEAVVAALEALCADAAIPLFKAEAERGPDQYETAFLHSADIDRVIADTERFKVALAQAFAPRGVTPDFTAKPNSDIPGSGLHVHLHLEDASGRNIFTRDGESFSAPLLHAVGGLLALMNPHMPIFAPREESYLRFVAGPDPYLVCPTATNVPTTISWGTNNRTVAVRLPSKPADNKHIEHRVAGSDADVAAVIEAILEGVHHGLAHKCDPGEPVYGDASLPQYALPKLAQSLMEARECADKCSFLTNYR